HAGHDELAEVLQAHPDIAFKLPRVVACSSYLADVLGRYPSLLGELLNAGRLRRPLADRELDGLLGETIHAGITEAECMRRLRIFRHRELLRIAWRDLNGLANVPETLEELSVLADAELRATLDWAASDLAEVYGTACEASGSVAEFVILAMGKLGGRELNFSSDIDLVFLYTDRGRTSGPRQIDNEQYFRLLAQRIIRLLNHKTADGFAYRVDARLRPFGDAGPLAVSLPAFEAYLLAHGRDWERYAYVKARVVNDWEGTDRLDAEILRPFVYRRYLDYGVFSSLRDMKAMIEAEGRRREYSNNLKLGPGGIREIEFIVQSLQLVRGGTIAELRERELKRALPALVRHGLLPERVADELWQAYQLLRRVENCLQAIADRQTHDLPDDEQGRDRLAFATGHADWPALLKAVDEQRAIVAAHFRDIVFRAGEQPEQDSTAARLAIAWAEGMAVPDANRLLEQAGLPDAEPARQQLQALRDSSQYRRMDEAGRQRLDALIPQLVIAAGRQEQPLRALSGAIRVVQAIGRRSAYLALLNENPAALRRLVQLCALSEFLVQQLEAHPLLLDELLDPRIFSEPPDRGELRAELLARLSRVDEADREHRLYAIVNFQQAATFRVAVADLSGSLPLMKVSDRLTDIAELVLQAALDLAWNELVERHGVPRCIEDGRTRQAGFAIVGYGKLGG
ncbi:MAG TPA: bifunctional [glutamate--ammonia ligase]-adenylyl-L-tyrosine phosphorylase/[glutamate--ammonia-ligase] adenylyltransferase, partial [Chromatiales bacterium]|nr:bifunctional [glutamate--ammonia ligase]-adenylyl-L-tyrosine phosphorylase/[glutamate--ammonia-ligase] adenylyltransferase [Chromatiales bacterium]